MARTFWILVSLVGLAGCGNDRIAAPSGPDPDITLATAPAAITETTIVCTGPAADVAALGALCTGEGPASAYHRLGDPLSAIARLGRSGESDRYLLVVGFAPSGTPDDGSLRTWDAAEVRHAAFLASGGGDVRATLESWMDAEPLGGELVTTHLDNGACSTGWTGAGTLLRGGVTIEITWRSTIPC